jgi:putative peptidoglycan lipid II flippase
MVLGLSLLAKFSGAIKEVVLARDYGTSDLMDQFVFAFSMASLPAALLTSILTLSLTPVLSQLGPQRVAEKRRFLAQLWGACLLLGLAVAAVLWWLFPGLSPVAVAGGPRLAAVVAVVSFLSCLSALATVVLICHGKQIASLLEGLPSLVLVCCVLWGLWSAQDKLLVGLVLGVMLQLLALCVAHGRHAGLPRVALPRPSREWRQLSAGLGFTAAGYGLLIAALLIEMNIASHLDSGSVASLGYATRVTALVTGLLLTAVNRAAIVHFCDSRTLQGSRWQAWGSVLLPFTAVAAAISGAVAFLATDIIALCFQRGLFDSEATAVVSTLMRWHIAQLAPSVAAAVLGAYLSATGRFRALFVACALCFICEVGFATLGTPMWGLSTLAAAPMVGRTVMFACLLVAVWRRVAPAPSHASSLQPVAAASTHGSMST